MIKLYLDEIGFRIIIKSCCFMIYKLAMNPRKTRFKKIRDKYG